MEQKLKMKNIFKCSQPSLYLSFPKDLNLTTRLPIMVSLVRLEFVSTIKNYSFYLVLVNHKHFCIIFKVSENCNMTNPLDDLLKATRWQNGASEAVEKIRELFLESNSSGQMTPLDLKGLTDRWKTMFEYLANTQNSHLTKLSSIEDHPDWFKGIM